MSLDTAAVNRQMNHFDGHDAMWLFGYGSLIYKAADALRHMQADDPHVFEIERELKRLTASPGD